ncbi:MULTISPECIES: HdeA/HdeB family chaperone [Paraburkholderia]|uniref:Acid stress chaperone HdeA n=1 Tax=Paraburkholderia aspalathi TaxID=1324617 RepID=A0A1I7EJH6_9BURK|nr:MULTISPECIES: HdeA/HdeB family chaperone [Paraburkholderia]PQV44178.1 acid stress chaperone HdeA [Paraburkholderia sp. BL21I4N1]SFU24081.1 acid stress chaperone HdeA [Paraburkholderia aspalathi]
MKKIMIGTLVVGLGLSQIGFAQPALKVQPEKMKCEDFLSLADNYKPALLYWTAGVDRMNVKTNDVLVVDAADPVGLVVDECRKDPRISFMGKVRQLTRSGRLNVLEHGDHR